ncbi:hypothetical protein PTTG_05233 [Puccinia triticina 1-1 BBBD Race 1]|uniref:Uncharacterized protein n=1 Tax=Puccinia triticina (isolate 1-1 / race 1 (BBBD)) TaxID=630390 RepID=A0A180GQJ1_PUCT1|nr:hypothetical protein PTTG_05233 [Puccinia triticina 1-1 BBBD Race 1]
MSGLKIQDTTNSVKAAAQQTALEAGEESQMAQQPITQTQEPDADGSQPAPLSQVPGPNPKPPKTSKSVKTTKPTTRAAAKINSTAPRAKPTPDEHPKEPLKDPEITEILEMTCEPTIAKKDSPTAVDDGSQNAKADRKTRAILMTKIVQAEKAGDDVKVERYMKMYESVLADQKSTTQEPARQENPIIFEAPVIPQKRPAALGETTQVRNVKFIAGQSNSHDDGGFPPYFHKLLLECKGPLPLTIFNRYWQEKALAKHSKNRPKVEETEAEKGLRYHGFPVPDEFSQNFSD